MTAPIDHHWHEVDSADGRCQRRRVIQVIVAGPAAIAMLVLFDAAQLGTGETTVASGSVRLVDQATDIPAPPPNVPDEVCRFNTVRVSCPSAAPPPPPGALSPLIPPGTVLPPGMVVLPGGLPVPPMPPGTILPPGSVVLPGGPDWPPLPSPVDLSQLGSPEVQQMLGQASQMLASPPPNVPNEVCRYNTVRVPC
jgi:hypothetical protein